MAEGMLGFEIDFGHGVLEFGQIEERVVAEAARAARRFEDESFDRAVCCIEGLAIAGGDEDAVVAGGALGCWNAGEALEQDHVVPDVGVVVGIWRVDEAGIGGETGGANAGRSVEGVDFEAGVIGEDEVIRCETGVVDSLEGSVGPEGGAAFFRGGNGDQAGQRFDEDVVGSGGGGEVAELSFAGGGGVEVEGHGESVTVVCEGKQRPGKEML